LSRAADVIATNHVTVLLSPLLRLPCLNKLRRISSISVRYEPKSYGLQLCFYTENFQNEKQPYFKQSA